MKYLIIYPKDASTDFLKPIYKDLFSPTLVTGGVTPFELMELIEHHRQVLLMGLGSSEGLLSMKAFSGAGQSIMDFGGLTGGSRMVYILLRIGFFPVLILTTISPIRTLMLFIRISWVRRGERLLNGLMRFWIL
jgi:hypothetical protein